jgi:protein ImuA
LAQAGVQPEQVLWVAPESPAEALWAMEQALRSGACAAVFGWAHPADDHALRRLKLAAAQGGALGVLFRPLAQVAMASPASLRLVLHPRPAGGLDIEVLKCQGGRPGWVRDALRHS